MAESIYDRAVAAGRAAARVAVTRESLLTVLDGRYLGEIPEEYLDNIRKQESFKLLEDWFQAAVSSKTAADFLDVMRR